jgi:hypothetical protein
MPKNVRFHGQIVRFLDKMSHFNRGVKHFFVVQSYNIGITANCHLDRDAFSVATRDPTLLRKQLIIPEIGRF